MNNRFFPAIAMALMFIGLTSPGLAGPESVATMQDGHDSKLKGTEWLVETIDGNVVLEDAQPTVTFDHEERLSGYTGCNRFAGAFTERGGLLEFSPLVSTRRACQEAVMHQEQMFLKAMEAVRECVIDAKGLLHLNDGNSEELMRLSPVSVPAKKN